MTPITTRFYYNIGAYIKLHSCFTAYDGRGGDHSWAQAALLMYGKIARYLALNYGAHQQIIAKDADEPVRLNFDVDGVQSRQSKLTDASDTTEFNIPELPNQPIVSLDEDDHLPAPTVKRANLGARN